VGAAGVAGVDVDAGVAVAAGGVELVSELPDDDE
jgi:hypothetical protein